MSEKKGADITRRVNFSFRLRLNRSLNQIFTLRMIGTDLNGEDFQSESRCKLLTEISGPSVTW